MDLILGLLAGNRVRGLQESSTGGSGIRGWLRLIQINSDRRLPTMLLASVQCGSRVNNMYTYLQRVFAAGWVALMISMLRWPLFI